MPIKLYNCQHEKKKWGKKPDSILIVNENIFNQVKLSPQWVTAEKVHIKHQIYFYLPLSYLLICFNEIQLFADLFQKNNFCPIFGNIKNRPKYLPTQSLKTEGGWEINKLTIRFFLEFPDIIMLNSYT